MAQASADRTRIVKLGLVVLALPNLVNGLFALVAPRSWFDMFSVGDLGGYNDHLVRDVGEAFIATSFLLLLAAAWMDKRVIYTAIAGWLVFNIPHLVNHIFERDDLSVVDYAGVLAILTFNVGLALVLFALTRRRLP
jgi:hypothetical protein